MPPSITPAPPSGPPGFSWSQTWIKALTQPSVATYEQIASDAPFGSNSKAYTWIFISALISSLISVLGGSLTARTQTFPAAVPSSVSFESPNAVLSIICSPVIAVIAVLFFAIFVAITNLIARALGGTGTYSKLLYVSAAISAPLSIINGILGLIPIVNCLSIPLGIYAIVLDVMAVKAVHQFGWGQAILSSFVIWIVLLILVAVLIIVILALLGPAIGDIFSNTVRSL